MRNTSRIALVAFLVACSPPAFEARNTRVVWDPAGDDFWDRPLPSDLRRQADGTYDFEDWPGEWSNALMDSWIDAAENRLDGWGLSSGVFVRLSDRIDTATLPDRRSSLDGTGSILLLDVDPDSPERGRFFPLDVSVLEPDLYTPENLLAAIPVFGFVRRPATKYALVVTDAVKDAAGAALGRSESFHTAWEDTKDAPVSLVEVRSAVKEAGVAPEVVVGVAVFTTMDPNEVPLRLARWAETLPQPALASPWVVAEEFQSHQVLTASFEVPVIQSGRRPYSDPGEGHILWNDDGTPQVVETQEVRLILSVPKQAQPSSGFPLTMILHGSGGNYRMGVDRGPVPETEAGKTMTAPPGTGPAEWLARRGVATLGFDFPLHGNRHSPPDTTGLVFYSLFGNVTATLDNFNVAIMELVILSRLTLLMTVDPALAATLDAGTAPGGLIRFDPARLTALGQSMGTTLGVPWATVDPRLRGGLWSGAGGMLVEIANSAIEPIALRGLIELLLQMSARGETLHLAHPILHAFQNVWDNVDPVAKARHVAAEPLPGFGPKHAMVTAGFRDGYFHPRAEAALVTAMGATLVGDEIEPLLPDTLRLAGGTTAAYPLQNNLNGKTVAAVQYAAPLNLGHYVIFNQDGARHQYTCFLQSVGGGGGARIEAAGALDDACP